MFGMSGRCSSRLTTYQFGRVAEPTFEEASPATTYHAGSSMGSVLEVTPQILLIALTVFLARCVSPFDFCWLWPIGPLPD